jgi:hypothetical protein
MVGSGAAQDFLIVEVQEGPDSALLRRSLNTKMLSSSPIGNGRLRH